MDVKLCWINLLDAIYTSGLKTNDKVFLNSDYGKALKEFLLDYHYSNKDEQYGYNNNTKTKKYR